MGFSGETALIVGAGALDQFFHRVLDSDAFGITVSDSQEIGIVSRLRRSNHSASA